MPLTQAQKEQYLRLEGYDPELYDLTSDQSYIIPKTKEQPTATTGLGVTVPKVSVAPKPETSALEAGIKTFAEGAPSAIAGGLAAGATIGGATSLGLTPFVGIPAGVIAGIIAAMGIRKAQQAIEPQEWQESVAKAAEEHPTAALLGSAATIPLAGFRPSLDVVKAAGAIPKLLTKGGLPMTEVERFALQNTAINTLLQPGIQTGASLAEGRGIPSLGELGEAATIGALFTRPWALGRAYGFPTIKEPRRLPGVEEVARARPQPRLPEVEPKVTPKEAPELVVPVAESQPTAAELAKAEIEAARRTAKKPKVPLAINKQMAKDLFELGYSAEDVNTMTPEQAQNILKAGMVRDPNAEIGTLAEMSAKVEAAAPAVRAAARARTKKGRDKIVEQLKAEGKVLAAKKAKQVGKKTGAKVKTQEEAALPITTEFQRATQERFGQMGYSAKPTTLWARMMEEFAKTFRSVQFDQQKGLVHPATGKEVVGLMQARQAAKRAFAKVDPDRIGLDTHAHELQHDFADLLRNSPRPRDQQVMRNYDKIVENSPDFKRVNAERKARGLEPWSADEFSATEQGVEFVNRQLNLEAESPLKTWYKDFRSYVKTRFTDQASMEDYRRLINYRLRNDPKFSELFGVEEITGRAPVPTAPATKEGKAAEEAAVPQSDYELYNQLNEQRKSLIASKRHLTESGEFSPEYLENWKQLEAVKNRNRGFVPEAPKAAEEAAIPRVEELLDMTPDEFISWKKGAKFGPRHTLEWAQETIDNPSIVPALRQEASRLTQEYRSRMNLRNVEEGLRFQAKKQTIDEILRDAEALKESPEGLTPEQQLRTSEEPAIPSNEDLVRFNDIRESINERIKRGEPAVDLIQQRDAIREKYPDTNLTRSPEVVDELRATLREPVEEVPPVTPEGRKISPIGRQERQRAAIAKRELEDFRRLISRKPKASEEPAIPVDEDLFRYNELRRLINTRIQRGETANDLINEREAIQSKYPGTDLKRTPEEIAKIETRLPETIVPRGEIETPSIRPRATQRRVESQRALSDIRRQINRGLKASEEPGIPGEGEIPTPFTPEELDMGADWSELSRKFARGEFKDFYDGVAEAILNETGEIPNVHLIASLLKTPEGNASLRKMVGRPMADSILRYYETYFGKGSEVRKAMQLAELDIAKESPAMRQKFLRTSEEPAIPLEGEKIPHNSPDVEEAFNIMIRALRAERAGDQIVDPTAAIKLRDDLLSLIDFSKSPEVRGFLERLKPDSLTSWLTTKMALGLKGDDSYAPQVQKRQKAQRQETSSLKPKAPVVPTTEKQVGLAKEVETPTPTPPETPVKEIVKKPGGLTREQLARAKPRPELTDEQFFIQDEMRRISDKIEYLTKYNRNHKNDREIADLWTEYKAARKRFLEARGITPENLGFKFSERAGLGEVPPGGLIEPEVSPTMDRTFYQTPIGKAFRALRPEVVKVAQDFGDTGKTAYGNFRKGLYGFYEQMREIRGQLDIIRPLREYINFWNPKEFVTMTNPKLERVGKYMLDESYGKTPEYSLSADEQQIYDTVRRNLLESVELKNAEPTLKNTIPDPEYFPQIPKDEVLDALLNRRSSPEAQRLIQDFRDYHTRLMKDAGVDDPAQIAMELKKMLRDFFGGYEKQEVNLASQFGPIDRSASVGIPPSWAESNILKVMNRFNNRYARRIAFERAIKSQDDVMAALDEIQTSDTVKNVLYDIEGKTEYAERLRNAVGGVIRAGMLQTLTGAKDFVSNLTLGFQHQGMEQTLKSAIYAFRNFKQMFAQSFKQGINRNNIGTLEWGDGGIDEVSGILRRTRDIINSATGRNVLEQINRTIAFGQGEYLAMENLYRAKTGRLTGQGRKFLDDFAPDWRSYLESGEFPIDELHRTAARFAESVQGMYDYRGLPSLTQRGSLAPVLALARWNVEKFGNFVKYNIDPALEGNMRPLLMSTLGALVGGTAVTKLVELATTRKERTPKWGEIIAASEGGQDVKMATAYKLAGLASLAGYAGVMGDVIRSLFDVAHKNRPQVYENPLLSGLANAGQLSAELYDAVATGNLEDYSQIFEQILEDYFQSYRLLIAQLSPEQKEEIARKTKYRDVKTFRQLYDLPTGGTGFERANPFINKSMREFKRTQDIGEAVELLPKLISDALEKAEGNPERLKVELRRVKQNNYQTMPSPERVPIEFLRYMTFLEKSQGKEAAAERLADYLKQREINRVKSSLVPSL